MRNKVINNTVWIVGCKIVQSVLQLVINMLSARYLGPSNYGLINYAASIAAFCIPIMQLGMRSTLVKEIVDRPEKEGQTMGTAIGMSVISSILCIIGITTFTVIANGDEKTTVIVCLLYSTSLIFQALEMVQYWFQAKLISKYTSLTMLFAYIVVSIYKTILLITRKNIYWFTVAQVIDFFIIAVVLLFIYKRVGGQKLTFSIKRGKELLSKSRYYIISGMMVTIFAQTDKIMLKFMVGDSGVGQYSAAVASAGLTGFIFAAIIDSFRPSIIESKKAGSTNYGKKVGILSAIIIYLSLLQSLGMTLFSDLIVYILYGEDYAQSAGILMVLVWYTTFSYMGSVRNIWILAEEKHKYLWIINMSGALGNIALNLALIPIWGVQGAAIASLITQIFTNFIIGFIMPQIRDFNKLMLKGLNPSFVYAETKKLLKNR
ncbi:MAG: flippase [Clostridia bacterium]|nr:flippase [Clostridia bacterium]